MSGRDNALIELALSLGATNAATVDVRDVVTDVAFRKLCEANVCGRYGRCHTCPPDIGDAEELIRRVRTYDRALVYKTVSAIEDSYDYEGMVEAKKKTFTLALRLRESCNLPKDALHLSAGGCEICEICSKASGEPCRHPSLALSSLEGYCINVYELAKNTGMKYTNGTDTVTYFGAIFFKNC